MSNGYDTNYRSDRRPFRAPRNWPVQHAPFPSPEACLHPLPCTEVQRFRKEV